MAPGLAGWFRLNKCLSVMHKVSIIIPVFNGSNYLREAIDSALGQTYQNVEIIVVNDGSSDGGATEQIALSYGNKIRYFSKENGGVASALNLAIENMTGDYFSWLSHDDLYAPEKIERQMRMMEVAPGKNILYGDHGAFFNDDLAQFSEVRLPHVPPERFRYFITTNNILHGCTLLIPRAAFVECGKFNEALRTTQDYDLWFRMAEKYRFVHEPGAYVMARLHAEQGSAKLKGVALREGNEMLIGFARNLSEAELRSATGESPVVAYARMSENFRVRGFSSAADAMQKVALQEISGTYLEKMKIVFILMRARLILVPMGWGYKKLYLFKTKVIRSLGGLRI